MKYYNLINIHLFVLVAFIESGFITKRITENRIKINQRALSNYRVILPRNKFLYELNMPLNYTSKSSNLPSINSKFSSLSNKINYNGMENNAEDNISSNSTSTTTTTTATSSTITTLPTTTVTSSTATTSPSTTSSAFTTQITSTTTLTTSTITTTISTTTAISLTSITSITSTSTTILTAISVSTTTSSTALTTTSTSLTTKSQNQLECSTTQTYKIRNLINNKWSLESTYDKSSDRINFIFSTNDPNDFRIAIYIRNEKNTQALLVFGQVKWAEKDETFALNSNETKLFSSNIKINSTVNQSLIQFSLPRKFTFSNGVDMRDCYSIIFDFSSIFITTVNAFLNQPLTYTSSTPQIDSTCLMTCGYAPKEPVQFYLTFLILNVTWSDDYNNLNSQRGIYMTSYFQSIIIGIINNSSSYYQVQNFSVLSYKLKLVDQKTTITKRDINFGRSNNIVVNSVGTVLSSNSIPKTLNTIQNLIANRFSDSFNNLSNPLVTSQDLDVETVTNKINLDDNIKEYSRNFAIALSCSLIVTTIVLGGALLAYYYWRRSKLPSRNLTDQRFKLGKNVYTNTKYATKSVKLESISGNNYLDEFELKFTNEAFNDTEYINYAGSREVGIDVEPFDQEIVYTSANQHAINGFNDNKFGTGTSSDLQFILNDASQNQLFTESAIDVPSPVLKSASAINNKLNFEDNFTNDLLKPASVNDHLTGKYLELAEKNVNTIVKKQVSTSNNKIIEENLKEKENEDIEDDESELKVIFSKVIEDNLSELFAPYKSENKNKNDAETHLSQNKVTTNSDENDKRSVASFEFSSTFKLKHESDWDNFNDDSSSTQTITKVNYKTATPINKSNINLDISIDSGENEYKTIDMNVFKNPKIDSKSNFNNFYEVGDDNVQNLNLINKLNNDQIQSNEYLNDGFENELEAEFLKPRLCIIQKDPNFDGLGIHLCDNRNHMIQDIEPNSPAEKGGLKPGDKILVINEDNVEEASYLEVVNKFKEFLYNQDKIKMIVMNAIEYNILKTKNENLLKNNSDGRNSFDGDSLSTSNYENFKSSLNLKTDPNEIFSNNQNIFDSNFEFPYAESKPHKLVETHNANDANEFNPFEDVPSEFFKPFMNYTIPPPDNFKASIDNDFFGVSPTNKNNNNYHNQQLNRTRNIESDDSEPYDHLVSQQSSKSLVQNFLNEIKHDNDKNLIKKEFFESNNSLNLNGDNFKNNNQKNNNKKMDKFTIENMSNSDLSDSPISENIDDYFK